MPAHQGRGQHLTPWHQQRLLNELMRLRSWKSDQPTLVLIFKRKLVCASLSVCTHMSANTQESQEKVSDIVQLEPQMVVNHLMVLRMEPGSSARETSGLSHGTVVPCRGI